LKVKELENERGKLKWRKRVMAFVEFFLEDSGTFQCFPKKTNKKKKNNLFPPPPAGFK